LREGNPKIVQLLLWIKRTGYRPLKPPLAMPLPPSPSMGLSQACQPSAGNAYVTGYIGSGVSTAPNPTTSDAKGRASVMAYSSDDPGPERVYVWTEHTPIWAVFDLTAIAPAP